MSSFCSAKATHIFSVKKFQHICVSLDVNFNELLTNDILSFEQLGPVKIDTSVIKISQEITKLLHVLEFNIADVGTAVLNI